jgi:spermidine/putrescine transport system permease protein
MLQRQWLRFGALLSPMLLYMLVFFAVPMLIMLTYSFWRVSGYQLVRTFTLQNYLEVFQNQTYFRLTVRSAVVGMGSAVLSILIAYPLAYVIAVKVKRHKDLLLFAVLLTQFSNYLIRIYGWRSILSTNGLADVVLYGLGLASEHSSYLLYSPTGVAVALTNVYVPVAVLPIYAVLLNIPRHLSEAARDLGANPLRSFYEVTLPLSTPGIVAAFVFIFLLSAGDFVTPTLVGGTEGAMIGGSIINQFGVVFNWPLGSAIAFALIFIMAGVLLTLAYLGRAMGILRSTGG